MLGRVTAEAAERFGDATCYLSHTGWTVSYADLDRLSDEVAAGMAARGVGEGDVVALVLPPIPEYLIAYVAAAKLGAMTAGVNARLAAPERAALVGTVAPTLVVATEDLADAGDVSPTVTIVPAPASDGPLAPLRLPGERPPHLADRDDPDRPVAIVFTSGTTGVPKGALFGNRQLSFITTTDTGDRWAERAGGATLMATSLAHLGPMTKLPGALHRGAATHLRLHWRAAEALRMVAEHRMASIGGIPTQLALMLQEPSFAEHDLTCVRAIVIGGGPATPALVREARARFGAPLAVRYSCTEAGIGTGTAFTDPDEDAELTVGRPQPGVELALRDPDDPAVEVRAGEVGEVCLRSPARMTSYWRNPAATAEALTPDGFVRTGDLGRLDDTGRLWLVGRSREVYVRGGYNVFPVEVEAVLAEHPQVAAVAVVPRPDAVMGEVGVAVVVPREPSAPPSLGSLRGFAEPRLAAYKLPAAVVVTGALPLTPMDKVDRQALRRLVAPGTAG